VAANQSSIVHEVGRLEDVRIHVQVPVFLRPTVSKDESGLPPPNEGAEFKGGL
jgi:hypothetical protein